MDSWEILLEIVLLLSACLVVGSVFAWFRQSPLVGYLLAGMFVGGPGSFGIVRGEQHIEAIAELGVALLLFSLGLEFSWKRVLELGTRTLFCGFAQVVITLLVALCCSLLFGLSAAAATAVGAMLSLSSTATVLRVLMDRGEMESVSGRNSLAVLLVQDMAVVPLAILISVLAEGGTFIAVTLRVGGILTAAIGVIAFLWVLLHYVAVPSMKTASFGRNRELAVLLSIIVGLGATWLAHAVRLSPALGAFMAGMFLGSSSFSTQIRADVASLRIVLLTLFFGAVGMVADPMWMIQHLPLVLLIAGMILLIKTVVIWSLFRIAGQPSGISLATGLCLSQVGEFAFVLGNAARGGKIIDDTIYSAIVSASIVTLFATPWLIAFAPVTARWVHRRKIAVLKEGGTESGHSEKYDVVVIGFGPAGQGAVKDLVSGNRRVLVVDLSPRGVATATALGFHGMVADATNAEVLEHLSLHDTETIVITLPSRQDALTVLKIVRLLAPNARIVVRSRYQMFHHEFVEAGADDVANDEQQIGDVLAEFINNR